MMSTTLRTSRKRSKSAGAETPSMPTVVVFTKSSSGCAANADKETATISVSGAKGWSEEIKATTLSGVRLQTKIWAAPDSDNPASKARALVPMEARLRVLELWILII